MSGDHQNVSAIIGEKKRRLHLLQMRAAREGHHTPPEIVMEIEDLQNDVRGLGTEAEHAMTGMGLSASLPSAENSVQASIEPTQIRSQPHVTSLPTHLLYSPSQQATIRDRFEAASAPLLAWPTDLGRGEWILRPELRSISDKIAQSRHSTILLLGDPGSGKSALLARLGGELQQDGATVLAIKADILGEEVKDAATLAAFLNLPASVGEHVRRLAASQKVVLLLDQLDALAALVDLRSGRLNVLLNLIREVDELPNIHIVCSCREFEHRHDARLTAIEADVIRLSLPTWEQVAEVLRGHGVPTEGWPLSFQELLRTPQHLKVFLQRLTDPSEQQIFSSYQDMLDDLWAKRVSNAEGPAGRSDLLMDVATAMANRENLWVPAALFEDRQASLAHLIGLRILTNAPDGAGIGFAHQTLFRACIGAGIRREKCSLADYALARQDGLFIRPTVWAGLTYLRGADPANYRREFGRLWNRADLRRHLRHLLLEFLGGVKEPNLQEESWLIGDARETRTRGEGTVGRAREPWLVRVTFAQPSAASDACRNCSFGFTCRRAHRRLAVCPVRVPYTPPPTLAAGSGEGPVDLANPQLPSDLGRTDHRTCVCNHRSRDDQSRGGP